MAYLTPDELQSHLYGEVINEIQREDATKSEDAIAAGIEEARSYMGTYDTNAIFSAEGSNRNPIVLLYVKDIAIWHFIQLANPSVDMQLRQDRYEKAIHFFEKIQSGKANPNLPYPAAPTDGTPVETWMKWGSNSKRNNYF